MESARRSAFEIMVVTVLVALCVIVGASLYAGRARVLKGRLLMSELNMLRSSSITYKLVNRKNSGSLDQLASEVYEIGGVQRPYVERLPRAEDGAVVDPFGHPYAYDSATGWVSSTSPGFERW